MRMTVDAMKSVAKDILRVQNYEINSLKRKAKSAEDDALVEVASNDLTGLASAFIMLGLVTNDEFAEVKKERAKKSDIAAIKTKKEWLCATAKTELPLPFISKEV